MRKLIISLLVLCLIASPLLAQGGTEKASSEAEPVTLTVLWFNDGNESDIFMDTMQDYLAEHPNIKIDLQIVAFADYQQKLKMLISGGNPPDVARMATADLTALINQALPIEDYTDTSVLEPQFMESMMAYAYNQIGRAHV